MRWALIVLVSLVLAVPAAAHQGDQVFVLIKENDQGEPYLQPREINLTNGGHVIFYNTVDTFYRVGLDANGDGDFDDEGEWVSPWLGNGNFSGRNITVGGDYGGYAYEAFSNDSTTPVGCTYNHPLISADESQLPDQGCPDQDGDGVPNGFDEFVDDPTQWVDSDGDGFGDNVEGTAGDSCPQQTGNSSKDSVGCLDTDGDGWSDKVDAFVLDPDEWEDSDDDGTGDNTDAFPNIGIRARNIYGATLGVGLLLIIIAAWLFVRRYEQRNYAPRDLDEE